MTTGDGDDYPYNGGRPVFEDVMRENVENRKHGPPRPSKMHGSGPSKELLRKLPEYVEEFKARGIDIGTIIKW